jgi:hypothetical protein
MLLALSRPMHIAGFVIAVVVYAIQTPALGALAHVGEKVLEVEPSIADLDATATIVLVSGDVWVQASVFHRVPNAVLSGIDEAMLPVLKKTTAALGVPGADLVALGHKRFTATTAAFVEVGVFAIDVRDAQDDHVAECFATEVDVRRHSYIL